MALKFLVDVGVGRKVEQWLSDSDHDVKTVRAIDPKMPDHAILQIAARENRIVVTMDRAHSRFHARFAIVARGEKAIFLNCSQRPDL